MCIMQTLYNDNSPAARETGEDQTLHANLIMSATTNKFLCRM